MPRTRSTAVLGVLALALSAACGLEDDGGPFGDVPPQGRSTGVAQDDVFTDGFVVLENVGDRPVRLLDVEFEDGAPGLELVGAKVAGLERKIGAHQLLPAFPPVDSPPDIVLGPLQEGRGYVIPAGRDDATRGVELLLGVRKELLLGMRKAVPGRATRQAVLVTYEVGGDESVARIVSTLAVCGPAEQSSCEHEFDDERRARG